MTATNIQNERLPSRAVKLYRIAGWSLFGICLLHFFYWSYWTWRSWPVWASGGLWGDNPQTGVEFQLHFEFWALPGSFMLPLLLLSLLIVWAARRHIRLPNYVGWGLLSWVVICSALMLTSGFPLGLVPGVLLVWANGIHDKELRQ